MESTIIFFSNFGRAMHARGYITAITEQPSHGQLKSDFSIRLINNAGNYITINTSTDFYIFRGTHTLTSPTDWTSYSRLELDSLAAQLPKEHHVFCRLSYKVHNAIPDHFKLVDLQPVPPTLPESKRIIGRLISEKLSQHNAF